MDGADAVDDLADAAGKLARRQLALPAEFDEALAHPRNDDRLDRRRCRRDHAQPEILHDDEDQRRQRLAAEKCRLDEGIAGKAADRLHLVLDHGGDFSRLHALEMVGRKAQHAVDQLEADAPQHALAEPALVGVDVELEETVQYHERQKDEAERDQHLEAVELQTAENLDMADQRQIVGDMHEGLRGVRPLETLALNRSVDDLLGQVEGQKVGDHGSEDHQQNPDLLQAGILPDVTREAFFHCLPYTLENQGLHAFDLGA